MGYTLEEILGQHHRMFVDPADSAMPSYRAFWEKLRQGEFQADEFRRIARGRRDVWLRASYSPMLDKSGKPFRIVKVAIDVTASKLAAADSAGQLAAISRSQAVIEFTRGGEVITANDNFCHTLGYPLEEIRGRHHRLCVSQQEASGEEYSEFWSRLAQGEF